MTEKLFYRDSHARTFASRVLSCEKEPGEETWQVILEETAFFPEGGGQAADTGTLGGARVLDVQEKEGIIRHKVDQPLPEGTVQEGVLDWEKRFSRMQQHTGEHIVSGIIHGRFGYSNVGFHLGEEVCTLDLDGPLTKEELTEVETAANEAVFACLPVQAGFPDREELEMLEYRSKIEIDGPVRIVTIPGVDRCACCAPHVAVTGEIGLIKFIHSQNYKGGVRITMVCGRRALKDYRKKEELVRGVMHALSASEDKAAEAVWHLKEEMNALKLEKDALKKQIFDWQAAGAVRGEEPVFLFEEGLSGSEPRELMNRLLEKGAGTAGVFTKAENGFRYVIGSRKEDLRPLCRSLNAQFGGKGGGKPEMVQGSLAGSREEILEFLEGKSGR